MKNTKRPDIDPNYVAQRDQRIAQQDHSASQFISESTRAGSFRSKFLILACATAIAGGTAISIFASDQDKAAPAAEKGAADKSHDSKAPVAAQGHDEKPADSKANSSKTADPKAHGDKAQDDKAHDDAKDSAHAESVEHASHGSASSSSKPTSRYGASNCLADAAAIEDMKRRREELEIKTKALETKESELKARERALTEELAKLQQVRDEISLVETAKKKENEEKLAKLVETIETMSPKAASQMIVSLDEKLAVAAMEKMGTVKLAKVMNLIEPNKASRLSELLTGVARVKKDKSASNGAAAATTPSAKGGEKENGHNEIAVNANGNESQREPASAPAGEKGSKR